MFDAEAMRERAVHLVSVGMVVEVVPTTNEVWVEMARPAVSRTVCGLQAARHTTIYVEEVSCVDCKRGDHARR